MEVLLPVAKIQSLVPVQAVEPINSIQKRLSYKVYRYSWIDM